MTFLSRYMLDNQDCLKLRITDVYSLHRVVWSLFPDERRILFADKGFRRGRRILLTLSSSQPVIGEYGSLEIKQVPEAFLDYSAYRFEIVINPVRRDKDSHKLEPLRQRSEIAAWFCEKAPGWGFSAGDISVEENHARIFPGKNGRQVTLATARLLGALKVTDREKFKHYFRCGIGRAKAFGCGLLQLEPYRYSVQ